MSEFGTCSFGWILIYFARADVMCLRRIVRLIDVCVCARVNVASPLACELCLLDVPQSRKSIAGDAGGHDDTAPEGV